MENNLFSIAIVDDSQKDREVLSKLLERYGIENGCSFSCHSYSSPLSFIVNFKPIFDLIFLDIQMPEMDGISVAEEIRKIDSEVGIIFETQFGQFAVRGYKVNAIDYFLKPVSYADLKIRLEKFFTTRKTHSQILSLRSFKNENGNVAFVPATQIIYIEQVGHNQIYHTDKEEFENTKR